jgi:hypothetical protein
LQTNALLATRLHEKKKMVLHSPAPYPPDTRSNGWKFDLDLDRVRQSDTWALAGPDLRPWLLMLWCEAWLQVPCGSLPGDDAVIAARLGMKPALFAKLKALMLRGWATASDGRLYHPVVTERVQYMLRWKDAEKNRKAAYRERQATEKYSLSHGTDSGQTRERRGKDGTTTTTENKALNTKQRAGKSAGANQAGAVDNFSPPFFDENISTQGHARTAAGALCAALRDAGIADPNPGHPGLARLLAGGIPPQHFSDAAAELAATGRGRFALLLKTVEGRWNDANAAPAVAQQAQEDPWQTLGGVKKMAVQLGCQPWDEARPWAEFKAAVRAAFEKKQSGGGVAA